MVLHDQPVEMRLKRLEELARTMQEDMELDALMKSSFLLLGFLTVGYWVTGTLLFTLLVLLSPFPYQGLLRARSRLLDAGEQIGVIEPVTGTCGETLEEEARRRAAHAEACRATVPVVENTAAPKDDSVRKRRVQMREVAGGGESKR